MAQVTSDALRVEVGLGSTWSTPLASITWTNVTSSVLLGSSGVSFSRGKSSTDTVARPGTLSLTLDNSKQAGTEGRFTPGGTNMVAGWGLRIPIRVRAKYPLGGASYIDLWYGFIESLEVGWDAGYRATVKVSATDRLARLQRRSMQSLIVGTQLADGAVATWPMSDAAGSTTAQNFSGDTQFAALTRTSYNAPSTSLLSFGDTTQPAPGPDGLLAADFVPQATNIGYYMTTTLTSSAFLDYTFSAPTSYIPSAGAVDAFIYPHTSGVAMGIFEFTWLSVYSQLGVSINASNKVIVTDGFGTTIMTSTSSVSASAWTHVAVTWSGVFSVGYNLYVNGALEATYTGGRFPMNGLNVGLISPLAKLFNGRIANVGLYPVALSAGTVADIANARTSYLGEAASARFNRTCAAARLSSTEYSVVGSTSSLMSEQTVVNRNVFDVAAEVAEAEAGALYLSRSGVLTLQARSNRYNPTSQFTLTAPIIDSGSGFVADMQLIVNDVTVQRKGATDGAAVRITNAASVATYDAHTDSVDMYVSTDAQAADAAAWLSNVNAVPYPRLTDVTVDLVTAASTLGSSVVSTVLSAEVGQMFTVSNLPSASTPATTLNLVLDGVSDSVTATSWKRTFVASSLSSSTANVWQLDSSTYSILDSTTRLAF